MIRYTSVSKEKFEGLGLKLTEEAANRYRLNDYYSEYWYCYAKQKDKDTYELGIKLDYSETEAIQDLVLSEINISDTYITICEKLEQLTEVSKWRFKKEFGQRKNEVPFDFVCRADNMEKVVSIILDQDKAKCYTKFQELLKLINNNGSK